MATSQLDLDLVVGLQGSERGGNTTCLRYWCGKYRCTGMKQYFYNFELFVLYIIMSFYVVCLDRIENQQVVEYVILVK